MGVRTVLPDVRKAQRIFPVGFKPVRIDFSLDLLVLSGDESRR